MEFPSGFDTSKINFVYKDNKIICQELKQIKY